MSELKDTKLWKAFVEKANTEEQETVRKFTKKAAERLSLYRDTFPTYTLHNETHAINVIILMGNLLGERVKDLTTLEAAILILSAYYHDTGMIFTDNERINIQSEAEFKNFLDQHPKAQLQLLEYQKIHVDGVPEDITEWYCRWIHPLRIYDILNSEEKIMWGSYPINEELGEVCKSHGYSVSEIIKSEALKIDMFGETDLKFCSIILRLADILDFDNSRSPDEVYKYLGLGKRENNRIEISDIEWRKHLCSDGFKFNQWHKYERYTLNFTAAPNEPAVESDIRDFLKVIEYEFEQCNIALRHLSRKWQDFKLPQSINKGDIKSDGYTFGEYKFTLEQDKIMNLLMGENLYNDKYVFIRELLQNAIDTTRHRSAYEKSIGNLSYVASKIIFTSWIDTDGYTWLRIDDNGMGMDIDIIINYFLKVGQSYYQSDRFKLDQLKLTNKNIDFTPISRFGIGILSCFIAGNKIEVSTKRIKDSPTRNALRISIENMQEFFILKEENKGHAVNIMPNKKGENEYYRRIKEYGTSICVRLDPAKDDGKFNLKNILSRYISCTPIAIECNNEDISGDYNKLILEPWVSPIIHPISDEEQNIIEDFIQYKFKEKLKIVIEPIDISKNSQNINLAGQAVICHLLESEGKVFDDKKIHKFIDLGLRCRQEMFTVGDKELSLIINARIYNEVEDEQLESEIDEEFIIQFNPLNYYFKLLESKQNLSHNGISVYNITDSYHESNHLLFDVNYKTTMFGMIALYDSLRLDMSLSRDKVQTISWVIASEIGLAIRRAITNTEISKYIIPAKHSCITYGYMSRLNVNYKELENNSLVNMEWTKEKMIRSDKKTYSVEELKKEGQIVSITLRKSHISLLYNQTTVEEIITSFLIQKHFNIVFNVHTKDIDIIGFVAKQHEAQREYSSMLFIPYSEGTLFRIQNFPININHPFSVWLLNNTKLLSLTYPALLNRLVKSSATMISKRTYENITAKQVIESMIIKEINASLDRLIELNYADIPPKNAYLTLEDFQYNEID